MSRKLKAWLGKGEKRGHTAKPMKPTTVARRLRKAEALKSNAKPIADPITGTLRYPEA
jgi:hypothetical protein